MIRIVDKHQGKRLIGFLEPSSVHDLETREDRPGDWRWTKRSFSIELVPEIRYIFLEFLTNNLCGCLEVEFLCGTVQSYGVKIGHNRVLVSIPKGASGLVKFKIIPPIQIDSDPRELGICLGEITCCPPDFLKDTENKLLYLHIPKCAGTSVDQYFRNRYGVNKSIRVHLLFSAVGDGAANFSYRQLLPYDYISGHFNPSLPQRMGLIHRTFTVLRHPVDRVMSQYHFYRSGGGGYEQKICRDYSLDELMTEENESVAELVGLKNLTTKILIGGATSFSLREDNIPKGIVLANAKSMLSGFLTVGFTDNLPCLLERLDPGRDMTTDKLEQLNQGQYQKDKIPAALRNKIEQVNDLDMSLYAWALENFA